MCTHLQRFWIVCDKTRIFDITASRLSANAVQRYDIEEHIIIEANSDVIERGKKWADKQPHKVTFLHGLWQDKVAEIPEGALDGVLYVLHFGKYYSLLGTYC